MTLGSEIQTARPSPVHVSWRLWLGWVAACAAGPVLISISATAVEKQVLRSHPYADLISAAGLALAALAILLVPLAKWLVLRRVLPAARFYLWFLAVVFATVLLVPLEFVPSSFVRFGQDEFHRASYVVRFDGASTPWRVLTLPWALLLPWPIAKAAVLSLLPAWALGRASRLRWGTLIFLVASVAATCIATILEKIHPMTWQWSDHLYDPPGWALNGRSWLARFEILSFRAGLGAIWGAASAFVVVLWLGRVRPVETRASGRWSPAGSGGLAVLGCAPVIIAVLAPFFGYLVGQEGIAAGAIKLRRTLSFAPRQDVSQGEPVLVYSHDIDVRVERWSEPATAPDGLTAIVLTAAKTLVQVDLATGRVVRQVTDGFDSSDRPSTALSPDGRYVAVRSAGASVRVSGPLQADRRQNRIRLYAASDMTLLGEFAGRDGCVYTSTFGQTLLFSQDGKSLWLACGSEKAVTTDRPISAMRFDVPAMTAEEIGIEGSFAVEGLRRVGGSVWTWQPASTYRENRPFRLYDLTERKDVASIAAPTELTGEMLESRRSQFDATTVRMEFCGRPPGAPADADVTSNICRTLTFDIATGALIGSVDEAADGFNYKTGVSTERFVAQGLRIDSVWRNGDKTGELVVRDAATGRLRQRIMSVAQLLQPMSPDGHWLVTACVYDDRFRVYRVQP